jgi:hypothetical protein
MVYRSRYLSMDDDIPRWIGTLMRFSLALCCLGRGTAAIIYTIVSPRYAGPAP